MNSEESIIIKRFIDLTCGFINKARYHFSKENEKTIHFNSNNIDEIENEFKKIKKIIFSRSDNSNFMDLELILKILSSCTYDQDNLMKIIRIYEKCVEILKVNSAYDFSSSKNENKLLCMKIEELMEENLILRERFDKLISLLENQKNSINLDTEIHESEKKNRTQKRKDSKNRHIHVHHREVRTCCEQKEKNRILESHKNLININKVNSTKTMDGLFLNPNELKNQKGLSRIEENHFKKNMTDTIKSSFANESKGSSFKNR